MNAVCNAQSRSKSPWDFSVFIVFVVLIATPLEAAEITRLTEAPSMVFITGQIVPGDDVTFSQLTHKMERLVVRAESSGGDVGTALRIGRIIRSKGAHVWSEGCFSSCVLLYAAGVRRVGGFDDAAVGVHRIYFEQMEPNLTLAQVQRRYSAVLNEVRQFLADMNVAADFLGFMQSIPPENMRLLTRDELDRYGLGGVDPVHEEKTIANFASNLGIASLEYRQRREEARRLCASEQGPTMDGIGRSKRSICESTHIQGMPDDEYSAKRRIVDKKCEGVPPGVKLRQCVQGVMRSVAP